MRLEWSTLPEARKKELFEGAHTFSHDHSGVIQTVKRLLSSGKFSLVQARVPGVSDDTGGARPGLTDIGHPFT